MPVSPIDGSYYFPETRGWVALEALAVGGPTASPGKMALEARDTIEYPKIRSLSVGNPTAAPGEMALGIGSPSFGRSEMSAVLTGIAASPSSRSALTVNPAASQYRALLSADVITSAVVRFRALMALLVQGAAQARGGRASLGVRQTFVSRSRLSLTVRGLLDDIARQAADVGELHETTLRMSADVAQMDGFLLLADVVGTGLIALGHNTAGYFPAQDINGRLTVGGVQVAIRSFTYQEPKGRLGAILNVVLADAIRTLALTNSNIHFDIVATDAGGVERLIPLVDTGKIAGRGYTIQWSGRGPGDELTISGLDTLADKFSLAPRQPVIMFDPDFVKLSEVEVKTRDAILTEQGGHILPTLEPVGGLTMMAALRRAYTGGSGFQFMTRLDPVIAGTFAKVIAYIGTGSLFNLGLGFANIITNIPDYPITRADFTIEQSWHDAVQGLIAMYGPIYFVESNVLYIVDAYKPLPVGHVPRIVTVSQYMRLGYEQPYREPYNAVLVRYQERGTDAGDTWAYREVVAQTTEEQGLFGSAEYQRTETYDRTRQKYLLDDPENVIEEQVIEHDVRVYGYELTPVPSSGADYVLVPGNLVQVSREVQQDRYGPDGLKVGHHKDIYGLVDRGSDFGLGPGLEPILVGTEDCSITWIQNPNDPAQMIQSLNFTIFEGLIYESDNTDTRGGQDVKRRYSVISAQNTPGIIKDDGRMFFGPIRTVTETLRRVRGNQLDVMVTERDLLWSGTVRESFTAPRTGTRSTNPFEVRGRTVMLRDTVSEAAIGPRVPMAVSAGELPRIRALELGHRSLALGTGQPPEPQLSFPGIDFAVRKGSVIQGQFRDGTLSDPIIVEERSITGENLGVAGQHRITMTVSGTELVTS